MTTDLAGRSFLVTGANTGIGRVTALELARRGGRVILACRSRDKTDPVIADIRAQTKNDQVSFLALDLSSLASVKAAAADVVANDIVVDVLVNNAGVAGVRGVTADGFEIAFGTNHLGHHLFTKLLLPRLLARPAPRIVNVSSESHYMAKQGIDFSVLKTSTPSVTGMPEYSVSKLANVLHAKWLHRMHAKDGLQTAALHPGVVASDIWQRRLPRPVAKLIGLFMISNEEGAQTTLHCATTTTLTSGAYYDKSIEKRPNRWSDDEALQDRLIAFSDDAVRPFV